MQQCCSGALRRCLEEVLGDVGVVMRCLCLLVTIPGLGAPMVGGSQVVCKCLVRWPPCVGDDSPSASNYVRMPGAQEGLEARG